MIQSTDIAGELRTSVCTGVIYRVTCGVREHQPLHRTDGGPLTIIATNEDTVFDIARYVLNEVTGSTLDSMSECGSRSMLPPLPALQMWLSVGLWSI